MLAVITLQPMAFYSKAPQSLVVLVALLVALIPTTIGALLPAIGIAGIDRLVQRNVLALSGRAVEAAGDVNTLLLDKTGTITIGNRQASEFIPVGGVTPASWPTRPSCPAWPTTRPRALDGGSPNQYGLRERQEGEFQGAEFVEFTAQTRMSGVDLADGREVRKGAAASVSQWIRDGGELPRRNSGKPWTASPRRRRPAGRGGTIAGRRGRGGRSPGPRGDQPQGHGQGGHRRAVRRDAQHGHPHRHDHRRQPADRQGHRGRVRRGRLPRRGHAGRQDGADQGKRPRKAGTWSR